MLCGFRQVRVVGAAPRWHGLLRSVIDARVDLHFSPGGPRDAAAASADASGVDVLWLWSVEADAEARELWAGHRVEVVHGPGEPGAALTALIEAMEAL